MTSYSLTKVFHYISELLKNFIDTTGYWGFFVAMILESTSIPVFLPAEFVLISAGYLVGIKKLNFAICLLLSIIGSMLGSGINYTLAFFFGRRLIEKYGKYIFVNKKRFNKFELVFNEYSGLFTFVGRFLPFIKHIVSIPPGLSRMNVIKFSLCTMTGSGLFSFAMLLIGTKIGENADHAEVIKPYLTIGFLSFVVFSCLVYYIYVRFANKILAKNQKLSTGDFLNNNKH